MSKKKKGTRRRTGSRQNKNAFLMGALAGAVITYMFARGGGGGGTVLTPTLPDDPGTGVPEDSRVGLIRRRLLPLSLDAPLPAKYIV